MNETMHETMEELFVSRPDLFPKKIRVLEDIQENFDVFRSLRRGSDTRATELKVDKLDIDVVNRWRSKEAAETRKPHHKSMSSYYAELEMLLDPFLRYTEAM